MVTRLRMANGLAGLVALAMLVNALPSRAGDSGGGGSYTPPGERNRDRDSDDSDDASRFSDASAGEAAMAVACGYASKPAGEPLTRDGTEVRESWKWEEGKKVTKIELTASKAKKLPYKNPLCEEFILIKLEDSLGTGGKKAVQARCERIRDDLFNSNEELRKGGGDSGGAGLSLRDALDSGRRHKGDDAEDKVSACESDDSDGVTDFACKYKEQRELLDDTAAQRQAAKEIVSLCKSRGADMTISWDTYASYTGSGLDAYGGGYCGNRGGPIIVRKENKWYDTLGNVVLGMTKVLAPVASMTYISYLQQQNAGRAIDANKALGFPSGVTAGQSGMFGVGGFGGGCAGGCAGGGLYGGGIGGVYGSCHGGSIYGGSGCGGYLGGLGGGGLIGPGGYGVGGLGGCASCAGIGGGYPYGLGGPGGYYGGGLGGGIAGGCGYTGLAGGCPYGAAYGNGGILVGGTGMGPYGGMYGGAQCGVPPYTASGCGIGGAGQVGYPYGTAGYPYGAGGYGAGSPYGGGNLLNPYGTMNGANGVGNPWGPNGMYGQAPYWGSNGFNANYAAQQAQMYQNWAVQMARQSTQSAQYARLYQDNMKDLQKVQDKAYQSYAAYQQASAGMMYGGQGVGGLGIGGASAYGAGAGYGVQGGSAIYQGGSYAPTYYSPYSSTGNHLSFGFNYSRR